MINRKNKAISRVLLILLLLTTLITYWAPGFVQAETNINDLALHAVMNQYNSYQNGAAVNGGGYTDFSSYDAYILDLAGADVDTWVYNNKSLKERVLILIDATIANPNETTTDWSGNQVYAKSTKRVSQDYLAAKTLGETEKAGQLLTIIKDRQTESGYFDNNAFSDIPAFELLGRAGDIAEINTTNAINYILDNCDNTTGAWTTSWNDFQTTAQAVRALYYLKNQPGVEEEVQITIQTAIDNGVNWMKGLQKNDGSFQDTAGFDYKITDTAEVIYTLMLLEIDPSTWVNSDKSPLDYMNDDALVLVNGTFGNIGCTTSAIDAYLKLGGCVAANTVLGVAAIPNSSVIQVNGTQQFTANAYIFNGTTEDVSNSATWSTANTGIATVNSSGLVTGVAAGNTYAIAVYEGVNGSASVTVSCTDNDAPVVQVNNKTVSIAVVGKAGNLLYSPGSVQITENDEFGLTAMSVLKATGLSWRFKTGTDGFIEDIAGETNEGMNGWCGKKNSTPFWDVPKEISVSEGDKIIFWYSMNANFNGPNWDDLLSGNIIQLPIPTIAEEKIKETLNSYKDELDRLIKDTNPKKNSNISKVLNVDKKMTLEAAKALKEELHGNKVNLTKEVGKTDAALGDEEVSLLIPENALSQTKSITVKELPDNEEPEQFGMKLGSSTYEFGPSGTTFDDSITISIKIALTEDLDIENLSPAWYDEQSKQWITIPGVIDYSTGLVVFRIDHFTKFAIIELPKATKVLTRISFQDVDDNIAWAKDAIEILAGKGIIKGTSEGIFEPQRSISRAEFVKLLITALQLEKDEYKNGLFSDVDSSNWFAASVASAYSNKYVSGYSDGTFKPENNISRNEVASIFHQIEGTANSINDANMVFHDWDSIPAWASNGVKYVYKQGLMKGYEDGTFKGINPLSRAEAAVVVYKYLNTVSKI
ncbi:MAG: hypothetical protein CVU90_04885 [Firmicutes bacterium HGW-Firmicutes-15]|nr:MAG: hypothetical protein CVU90_04885 [Firmicutes bacterium HGW-Firmicutes-15]